MSTLTPRWRRSRTVRAVADAGVIVVCGGLLWVVAVWIGLADIPACAVAGQGACGIGMVIVLAVALVVFAVAAAATWAVVRSQHAISGAFEPYRFGRWLSLHEVEVAGAGRGDLAVEVHYHDVVDWRVAGVRLELELTGRDANAVGDARLEVVTDQHGVAVVPVHVVGGPAVLNVRVAVPDDPAVRAVAGVFVVGI